jgi:hypothetical protein
MKSSDDDDYIPYLFVSESKGTSWKDISAGLPAERINCIIEDPYLPELIFIGTDRGVYASPDGGKIWVSVSGGLTTVSVQKLSWAEKDEFLVAATHGMSLFACPASAVRKYFKSVDPAVESILSVFGGSLPGSTDFPGHWDWDRHRSGSIIWYQPRSGEMTISIEDSAGKEIMSKRHKATEGLNHWDWDLILSKKEDASLYPLPEYKFPAPGTYAIAVQGQGMILRTTLEVR